VSICMFISQVRQNSPLCSVDGLGERRCSIAYVAQETY